MSTTVAALSAHRLSIGHREAPGQALLRDLDLRLEPGQLVCLLGRNGCGKTTLLRTLGGLLRPIAGVVRITGEPLESLSPRQRARRLAVLLTERAEPALLRVREVVSLGRYPHQGWWGAPRRDDQARVELALQETGLLSLACRRMEALSDGERQKVAVARALAQDPAVLLLDEPTAFLDLAHRAELMSLLHTVARDRRRAVLLSTHDLELALRTADQLWLVSGGELVAGAPEDLGRSGCLAEAFAGPGIRFDSRRGSFSPIVPQRGQVALVGDQACREDLWRWTARALARIGLDLSPYASLQVTLEADGGAPLWSVVGVDAPPCRSLGDLVDLVEDLLSRHHGPAERSGPLPSDRDQPAAGSTSS